MGRFDLSQLRQTYALTRSDKLEAHTGVRSHNMFGITEGLVMGSSPDDPAVARHESVGRPVCAHDEVRLLHPGTEDDVAMGDVGELCFRGPSAITGYYGDASGAQIFTSDGF